MRHGPGSRRTRTKEKEHHHAASHFRCRHCRLRGGCHAGLGTGRPPHRLGRSRPAGHLGLPDHHTARAPGGTQRQGVPDRRRGGPRRTGGDRTEPGTARAAGRADRGGRSGRPPRRRIARLLQQLLARPGHADRRHAADVARHRPAERPGPEHSPEGKERTDARRAYLEEHPADSWHDRTPFDRCILGFNAGPPITPGGYNQNMQVFQTPGHVVLVTEMVHTHRVVPLDGRPALDSDIRQWSGDARGYWEGDTLVIETTNFNDARRWRGTTRNMTLVERLTRIDADTLEYRYTVTDPETWVTSWTVSIPMQLADQPMYEYACHEGNYSMDGILAGHRAEEAEAAAGR